MGTGRNVLVVDDDMTIAQMVARIVEFNGHTPVIETDSLKAATLYNSNGALGAAIVDLMMPGLNGIELLAVLMQQSPQTRRILLTASPKEPEILEALKEGIIHKVVSKPPTLHDLELVLAWL